MKKIAILGITVALLLALVAVPAMAAPGKHGPAGKSNVAFLYLYEKDPSTWEIVDGGAWGKLKYNLAGPEFEYVFNGHGVMPDTGYSLVYYRDYVPEVWPHPVTVIAQGAPNAGGNIHLAGSVDLGKDLPELDDANYPGAKIWLVPTYHIAEGKIVPWIPTEILFEHDLITYDDTDV